MEELGKEAAETIEKLSSHVQSLERNLRVSNRALDIALTKLAKYEHFDECHKIAMEFFKKGYISEEEIAVEAKKLYQKKVSELKGIKDTLAHMGQVMPSWGSVDGDVNVTKEASNRNSSDCLGDIVDLLNSKV